MGYLGGEILCEAKWNLEWLVKQRNWWYEIVLSGGKVVEYSYQSCFQVW